METGNEITEYDIRKMQGIPASWMTYPDAQVMKWAQSLSELPADAAEDLAGKMWDELAERDHERETFS